MKRTKCEECNGKIILKNVEVSIHGISLGKFPADVCSKCGEEVFEEKISSEIENLSKARGLWGLDRKVKIVKIGNSLAVRIDRKSTRLNSSHSSISYAVFCLKK